MSANTAADQTASELLVAADDSYKPCACSFVHVQGEDLRCKRVTKNTFAPGHDAKLKSRLIAAEVQGLKVREVGEDGKLHETTAALAAGRHGFGYQVAEGVARARRRANEKAERRAAREAVREANAATREAAKAERAAAKQAKVGRWVVTGTVAKNGDLSYTTKAGVAKVAKAGKYELQDA